MQDIVPELREAVENSFTESVKKNEKIQKILEKVQAGTATYEDADEYAAEIGEALANAFREHISSDILPDGKMYYNIASRLVPGPCRLAQAAINNVTGQIQRDMNEKAGLSIKPQIPKYNEDREKGLIEYMCGADRYDDVSKSATADIVNFIQSMVTDAVKANAEFQWRAGLSPVIRRTANGGCCAWCAKLAGVYPYEDVRATGSDVYRRHRDCRCKVTYDPGDGKVQNVHTKRWKKREEHDTISLKERPFANGPRRSPMRHVTQKEQEKIIEDAKAIGIPPSVLRFNEGNITAYNELLNAITVRGDIFPDEYASNRESILSVRAVLAHEYYGHYKMAPSRFKADDWRDEFSASYRAALDAPGLSDEERRLLIIDAYDRAKQAGVSVVYNSIARRLVYGYE